MKNLYLLIFVLCFFIVDGKNINIVQQTKDKVLNGLSMYEISTRPWLYSLSQKYGNNITLLSQVPEEELQAIADQKFDFIWMMGLWHLGEYGLYHDRTNPSLLNEYSKVLPGCKMEDIIGSPYAITNYTCNPELGSNDDILSFKKKLNSMGMKLMVDFVPNHSAVDCDLTTSNPQYYVLSPKGTQPPYNPSIYLPNGIAYGSNCPNCGAWTDTAQFNYWNQQLRKERITELLKVASLSDAIRCDMAFLLLNDQIQQNWGTQLSSWGYSRPSTEWWSDSIAAVKKQYPNIIFLAEVYDPFQSTLQSLGFDYTYDKNLYDKLGNGNLDDIRNWISSNSLQFLSHSAHFISNHDEPRAPSFFGSPFRANAAALITFTIPGMRFYWMWQFNGFSNRLDIHLRREEPEPVVDYVESFYETFLPVVMDDVFKYGQWTYLNVFGSDDSWRLIAYTWQYGNKKRLCVLNYSDTQGSGKIIVPNAEPVNGNDTISVTDLLSGDVFYRSASNMKTDGLFVVVNQWYGQIFEY